MSAGLDVVQEVRIELARMSGALEQVTKILPDHETRLRRIERWLYAVPVAFILAAGDVLSRFVHVH